MMAKNKWTTAQQKVIDTRNRNILVSAAAGSGKTAVLVERIINRILDTESPIDVDKILVVTFTNAAASEMRERILKAIEKELEKAPDNLHLQRQQAYIHNASITTIHSFCLNLIREHFNDVDLDPGVRVADTGEIELLKSDVMREVLEEFYSAGEDSFYQFVNQFEGKNNDDYIEEMVLTLYKKAMGYPWPEEWLADCIRFYEYENVETFQNSVYVKLLSEYADGVLQELVNQYHVMLELCDEGGMEVYKDLFCQEQEMIAGILAEQNYDTRRSRLNMQFERLPRCGKNECDEEIKKLATDMRTDIKDTIKKLRERIYYQSLEEALVQVEKCRDIIETYIAITKRFMEQFKAKKRDKNIMDFDDFEHYAIQILVTKENGIARPSKTADELAKEFQEVMVDEYQDSNLVQETILSSLSGERFGLCNRFMVGDVKQSIYGFRGANPDIFIEKYNQFTTDNDTKDYKIILDKNFRSRKGVIDTTNFFFTQIMSSQLGGIDYDDENRLYLGNEDDVHTTERVDDRTELILINTKEEAEGAEAEEDMSATAYEAEAKVIAKRIKELTDKNHGMCILDKETKQYRILNYSDIAILLRSTGKMGDSLAQELQREGIPAYMESRTGYFNTLEIRTIINYLRIIDNPIQDLPLAAVLKSPIVGVTDEELAVLRAVGGKNVSLYENICQYLHKPVFGEAVEIDTQVDNRYEEFGIRYDVVLAEKLQGFFDLLEKFRERVICMSIYDILNEMLERTRYYDIVRAMPSGEQRIANVEMLKQKASDYENGSYKGLFHFIRYIEKLNKYDVDMGEASILSENDNTVKIMTIHKSKGLEFPVVFVANLNKQFNQMDARKKSIVHSKYGIGMDYIENETRVKTKNLIKLAIVKRIELDTIEEEMRLFYVACTRARDKLIFTASGVDEKRLERMTAQRKNASEVLGYGVVSQFRSYLDFVSIPLARNKAFQEIYMKNLLMPCPTENPCYLLESNVSVTWLGMQDIFDTLVKEKYLAEQSVDTLRNLQTEQVYEETLRKQIENTMSFAYFYQKETETHAKMSVSEIKKISYEMQNEPEDDTDLTRVDFMETYKNTEDRQEQSAARLSGAKRGTAYHTVFECFDFDMEVTEKTVIQLLNDLEKKGRLSKEERNSIRLNDILAFAESDLCKRMRAAHKRGELYREAQFVVGFSDSEVEEFKRIAKVMGEEQRMELPQAVRQEGDLILIQGIIDVYFIEDGKLILADYKTDRIKQGNELVNHYFVQLELYKKAVEQVTGMQVSEKILYSVYLGEEIKC